MKFKTSFFHKGLALNLLRRCWPVWLAYLALMIFEFPMNIYGNMQSWRGPLPDLADMLANNILQSACSAAEISFFACIVVVMAVFGYLYNMRTCGMINAFPVRRETVFCTFALTGLVPMLLADCLAALLTVVLIGNAAPAGTVAQWLSMAVMSNVAFYGFGVFCAMLTGSLFILPLVYLVLNFTAVVVEECLHALLDVFLYGYARPKGTISWLSPGNAVFRDIHVRYVYDRAGIGAAYSIENASALITYCVFGVVFLLLALLLYRKRRMEAAGDTVAIPVLKPVFKYCMAFGTALVLAGFVTSGQSLHSRTAALLACAMLLLGAFIGYFTAEMLMQKTVHVFTSRWKGLIITWAILLVFSAFCEADLIGYEKRLPSAEEVESVSVGAYGMSELREAQNIADAVAIHRDIIAHKDEQEKKLDSSYATTINYEYHLKNGRTLRRTYRLASGEQERQEKGDLWQMQELLNRPEAILDRVREENGGLTPESIDRASVYTRVYDERTRYETEKDLVLTAEQARDLYLNGILPDMEEGRIGRMKFFEKDDRLSDTSISLELSAAEENFLGGGTSPVPARRFYSPYFSVDLDSVHTIAWLKENAGLEVMPYTRPSYEDDTVISAPVYTGVG